MSSVPLTAVSSVLRICWWNTNRSHSLNTILPADRVSSTIVRSPLETKIQIVPSSYPFALQWKFNIALANKKDSYRAPVHVGRTISCSSPNLLFPSVCLCNAPFEISNALVAIRITRTILASPLQESTISLNQVAKKHDDDYCTFLASFVQQIGQIFQ